MRMSAPQEHRTVGTSPSPSAVSPLSRSTTHFDHDLDVGPIQPVDPEPMPSAPKSVSSRTWLDILRIARPRQGNDSSLVECVVLSVARSLHPLIGVDIKKLVTVNQNSLAPKIACNSPPDDRPRALTLLTSIMPANCNNQRIVGFPPGETSVIVPTSEVRGICRDRQYQWKSRDRTCR